MDDKPIISERSPEYLAAIFFMGTGMAILGAGMAKSAAAQLGPAKIARALRSVGGYNNVLVAPTPEGDHASSGT